MWKASFVLFLEYRTGRSCGVARIADVPSVNCDPAKLAHPPPFPAPTPRPTFPSRETEHRRTVALSLAFLRTAWHRDRIRTLPVSSRCQARHSLCPLRNGSEIRFGWTAFLIPQRIFSLDMNLDSFAGAGVRIIILFWILNRIGKMCSFFIFFPLTLLQDELK